MIAALHLIPKQRDAHGLRADQVDVTDDAIARVVHEYTREAGVRNLDRLIATLFRKVAAKVAADASVTPLHVDAAFAGEALGAPPHLSEVAERTEQAGVVVGLAATQAGGDILFIEAAVTPGGDGLVASAETLIRRAVSSRVRRLLLAPGAVHDSQAAVRRPRASTRARALPALRSARSPGRGRAYGDSRV